MPTTLRLKDYLYVMWVSIPFMAYYSYQINKSVGQLNLQDINLRDYGQLGTECHR